DRGFTKNGGTSASGAGPRNPWGRNASSQGSDSSEAINLYPWREFANSVLWSLILASPDDQTLWLLYFYLNGAERIEISGQDPSDGGVSLGIDDNARFESPTYPPLPACRGNPACPKHWEGTTPPEGFGAYYSHYGEERYHCGGRVFVETNCTSSGLNY